MASYQRMMIFFIHFCVQNLSNEQRHDYTCIAYEYIQDLYHVIYMYTVYSLSIVRGLKLTIPLL